MARFWLSGVLLILLGGIAQAQSASGTPSCESWQQACGELLQDERNTCALRLAQKSEEIRVLTVKVTTLQQALKDKTPEPSPAKDDK